jgi:preprotein translocase subunit SecY
MKTLFSLFTCIELRKRVFFVLIILAFFRLGSHIPLYGVDLYAFQSLFKDNSILGFFNLFSGGAISRFSLFSLGILPFINASIIMQLMNIISNRLKELSKDGDFGRKQIASYTRFLTLFLAIVQSLVMVIGFRPYLYPEIHFYFFLIYSIITLAAGAIFVMWLGELITDYGVGNGASLIIFVGIISSIPSYVQSTSVLIQSGVSLTNLFLFLFFLFLMIISIVFFQEADFKIPIQYSKSYANIPMQTSYLPLRLVQSGVMPIIFASALLQFPLILSSYFQTSSFHSFFEQYFSYETLMYNLIFCLLIFFFTFFYNAITFSPNDIANNIKNNGGFILGIRPGTLTAVYLDDILTKLTFIGALFLSIIALVPTLASNITRITSFLGLGGTAILIIVGVAMDLIKQCESYVINHQYEGGF